MSIMSMSNAQALSKKAGVEFSIADISGDDLMSQREALATQGVKVRDINLLLTHNQNHLESRRCFLGSLFQAQSTP